MNKDTMNKTRDDRLDTLRMIISSRTMRSQEELLGALRGRGSN